MEYRREKAKSKSVQALPPRRGQIKLRILKSLVKSAAELVSAGDLKRKDAGSGVISPVSDATPAQTPSGYDSGVDSDYR